MADCFAQQGSAEETGLGGLGDESAGEEEGGGAPP